MSISAPRRPSSVASDPKDRTSHASAHNPSKRRPFPGWRWMAVLGLRATPLADAVEQTVRWYRTQARASSAADQGDTRYVAPGLEAH